MISASNIDIYVRLDSRPLNESAISKEAPVRIVCFLTAQQALWGVIANSGRLASVIHTLLRSDGGVLMPRDEAQNSLVRADAIRFDAFDDRINIARDRSWPIVWVHVKGKWEVVYSFVVYSFLISNMNFTQSSLVPLLMCRCFMFAKRDDELACGLQRNISQQRYEIEW